MSKLILAAFAVVLLASGATTANAVGCPTWMCGSNGIQLNGIAFHGDALANIKLDSVKVVLPR